MTRKSARNAPLPDIASVHNVIHLAVGYADAQRTHDSAWCASAREQLFGFLRGLPDECLAGLYALYRLGDGRSSSPAGNLGRYRSSYNLVIQPHHLAHAAADLVAKGPIADGLRRGLSRLGLGDDPGGTGKTSAGSPNNARRIVR